MFKLIVATIATILAVASAAPKPGFIGAPVAYSAPLVSTYGAVPAYGAVSTYGAAPVVSAYGAAPVISAYGAAPVVSGYGSHLAYSAHSPILIANVTAMPLFNTLYAVRAPDEVYENSLDLIYINELEHQQNRLINIDKYINSLQ
ncbi:unnamed protein product [Ceutorhynchus assimilis]|uniref:Uncharacterized protein n=1 Tax=Ceutorhynchus assimilis TaxID=467358 RepID=A0A9N9MUF5_9CUCU|nr:unnamed protein product [Ceutorhynchus assimilis]